MSFCVKMWLHFSAL